MDVLEDVVGPADHAWRRGAHLNVILANRVAEMIMKIEEKDQRLRAERVRERESETTTKKKRE